MVSENNERGGTNRVDYLRSPDCACLDGRGHWLVVPEAASDGALAVRPVVKSRRRSLLLELAGSRLLHALDDGWINVGIGLLQRGDAGLGINGLRSLNLGDDDVLFNTG